MAMPSNDVCISSSSPSRPAYVAVAGCVTRLAPSRCTRLSRARSTMSQSDFPMTVRPPSVGLAKAYQLRALQAWACICVRACPFVATLHMLFFALAGVKGISQVLRCFSFPMPGTRTTADPRESLPRGCFRLGFVFSVFRLVSRRCHNIPVMASDLSIPLC